MSVTGKHELNTVIGKKLCNFFIVTEHLIFTIKFINRARSKKRMMSNCYHLLTYFAAIIYLCLYPVKLVIKISVETVFPSYSVIIECKKPCIIVKLRNIRKSLRVLCYSFIIAKITVNLFKLFPTATVNNILSLFFAVTLRFWMQIVSTCNYVHLFTGVSQFAKLLCKG